MKHFMREFEKVKDRLHPAVYVFSQNENWVTMSDFLPDSLKAVRAGYRRISLIVRVAGGGAVHVQIRSSL